MLYAIDAPSTLESILSLCYDLSFGFFQRQTLAERHGQPRSQITPRGDGKTEKMGENDRQLEQPVDKRKDETENIQRNSKSCERTSLESFTGDRRSESGASWKVRGDAQIGKTVVYRD